MVEDGDYHCIGLQIQTERGEGLTDGSIAEIAHHHMGDVRAGGEASGFAFVHDHDSKIAAYGFQVVVETAGGVGCGIDRLAGTVMIFSRPTARPATHQNAGQEQGLLRPGSSPDLIGDPQGG